VKKKINQIRELLDEIEKETLSSDDQTFVLNFSALELPDILCSIVDFLQPALYPYEAAVYWHLFRNSILANGTQYTRASVRGMMQGVITSSSGQTENLSYGTIQKALLGLEQKTAISKAGDTDRNGTLYKIHLPEEIPLCQELMRKSENVDHEPINLKKEIDFYNVSENRLKVFERDNYKCKYCAKQLTRFTATLDHVQPVSQGGDNSFDNLVTACLHCNSQRGSRPVMDILSQKAPNKNNDK
jgi:hypothetical protein